MKKTLKNSEAVLYTWRANKKNFLVRELTDKNGEDHYIGELALSDELESNPTQEVTNLDEQIIYYVERESLIELSDKELADLIYKGSSMEEFNF